MRLRVEEWEQRSEERLLNGGIGITKSVKETKSGRTRMGKIVKDCQAKQLRW